MKRTRSIMLAAILLLSAMVVFAGTAAAIDRGIKFYGDITDAGGNGIPNVDVEIEKRVFEQWRSMGSDSTDDTGHYETSYIVAARWGHYRMIVNGNVVGEKDLTKDNFDRDGILRWSHKWNHQIPEFATIAIPAIALLGLYAFYRRKQKK